MTTSDVPVVEPFENILGKGENGGKQHFMKENSMLVGRFNLSSANASNLDKAKICQLVIGERSNSMCLQPYCERLSKTV